MYERMSIWFFCGTMFLIYGIVIVATGIHELSHPPNPAPVLFKLHPSLWWGGFMGVAGLVYTIQFRPRRRQNTDKNPARSLNDSADRFRN